MRKPIGRFLTAFCLEAFAVFVCRARTQHLPLMWPPKADALLSERNALAHIPLWLLASSKSPKGIHNRKRPRVKHLCDLDLRNSNHVA
jgi:hypothetical protein